jgi:hypothetical protein
VCVRVEGERTARKLLEGTPGGRERGGGGGWEKGNPDEGGWVVSNWT